jgi:UDP-3-O-acyl N-acetylglucosamine deacetylase
MTASTAWPRQTVARANSLSGPCLATGAEVTVTLRPAPTKTGLVFRHVPTRTDIPANLAHVAEVPNCTSLRSGEARIDFVEHLMAALWAERITDAIVEVDGGEIPLLDGSARPYVALARAAGKARLAGEVPPIRVGEIPVVHGEGDRIISAGPGEGYSYLLDHPHPLIGLQAAAFFPASDDFATALAPARTFATEQEARMLLAARDLKGAQPEMAIIAYDDHLSEPEPMPDSFARHKLVDMIGDLYLLGRPLEALVIGTRTGHAENQVLAAEIVRKYGIV